MDKQSPPASAGLEVSEPWYVYDRYSHLLRITETLQSAEAWVKDHWGGADIASRQDVALNDYWYLLRTVPGVPSEYHDPDRQASDYQARVLRRDRVVAIGRNPDDVPAAPDPDLPK